jgi:hypothetical protein
LKGRIDKKKINTLDKAKRRTKELNMLWWTGLKALLIVILKGHSGLMARLTLKT